MYKESDPEKSAHYAFRYLEHNQNTKNIEGIVRSYRMIGEIHLKNNEFYDAKDVYKQGYDLANKNNLTEELIRSCANLGTAYMYLDEYKKSLQYFLEFLELSKKEKIPQYIAIGYNNLGLINYRIGDYASALEFYLSCINTKKEFNLYKGLLYNYYNIGLCYIRIKKFHDAIQYFNRIISDCNNCEINNIIYANYGLGKTYFEMKIYKEALKYLEISTSLSKSHSRHFSFANSCSLISEVYINLKDYDNAIKYLDNINKNNSTLPKSIEYKIMLQYSEIYEALGDFEKSLKFRKRYNSLKDSVFSDAKVSEIKKMLTDYQLSESENIIKNKDIQIHRNRQFAYMLFILILLLTLLLYFAYHNIRIRKKLNDRLSNIVKEKVHELNAFFYRTSHDLAGPVATIKGLLRVVSMEVYKSDIDIFLNRMESTNQRLEAIIDKLNKVSYIRSKTLEYEKVDIESLITDIIKDVQNGFNHSINVFTNGSKLFRTDRSLAQAIFHNLILNSIQHVDHREIRHEVNIEIQNSGNLLVRISDNGKGIEKNYSTRIFDLFYVANDNFNGNGLGLYQARLAARRLNGDIKLINSKKPISFEIYLERTNKKTYFVQNNNIT